MYEIDNLFYDTLISFFVQDSSSLPNIEDCTWVWNCISVISWCQFSVGDQPKISSFLVCPEIWGFSSSTSSAHGESKIQESVMVTMFKNKTITLWNTVVITNVCSGWTKKSQTLSRAGVSLETSTFMKDEQIRELAAELEPRRWQKRKSTS